MITKEPFPTANSMPYPVPVEVLYNFDLDPEYISRLGGGLINSTFLAESGTTKSIVQKLGAAITVQATADADIYTKHLDAMGWEAPLVRKTIDGQLHHQDKNGNIWRNLKHINSDQVPVRLTPQTWYETGALLGRWHRDMKQLAYQPEFSIPHFHDTEYHADKLERNIGLFPTESSRKLATHISEIYNELGTSPDNPTQLLHGDPKIDNMIFRNGKPFTFIDLDTVMHGPIWLDMGDMIRSAISNCFKHDTTVNTAGIIQNICRGYFGSGGLDMDLDDLEQVARKSARQIALELAMRYMNDIIDDSYFEWDRSSYATRHDSHVKKANMQLFIHNNIMFSKEK